MQRLSGARIRDAEDAFVFRTVRKYWSKLRPIATTKPFQVISAYRSPDTNQMLRDTTAGVAKDSMHLRGQAIDVRLADVPLDTLRAVALDLQRGGVGFYPESEFVHVDTGRVRRW